MAQRDRFVYRKRHLHAPIVLLLLSNTAVVQTAQAEETAAIRSLAGEWGFQLDPDDNGVKGKWYENELPNRIQLPGTTDEGGYGTQTTTADEGNLTRAYEYVGAAWYQRDVTLPESWRGKVVQLNLERCLWQTRVWIDGVPIGERNSLTTPHRYEIGTMEPGRHRITIRVDNRLQINIGTSGHSYTKHTQSMWNGIVGRIELRASDPVWIGNVRIIPDAKSGTVRLLATIRNQTGRTASGNLTFRIQSDEDAESTGAGRAEFTIPGEKAIIEGEARMTGTVRTWDEFSPSLYELAISLSCHAGDETYSDDWQDEFGFRDIQSRDKRILLNGRPIFLRGTLDCCIFPLTGYPPPDVESWLRICETVKSYGMNHIRFHSWCPPEAAFIAADRTGVLLQAETPMWIDGWMSSQGSKPQLFGKDPEVVEFIQRELDRILEAYGNHPSFCMMAIGNEIGNGSDYELLASIIQRAKTADPRRLYAVSTARALTPADDFYVTHNTPGGASRGIGPPKTDWDFSAAVDSVEVPVISHEIGQWAVYPDYREIGKYTGVLKPRNYEKFRDVLTGRGMADQSHAFQQASGALALLLYKHEIEAMFRTPRLGGFQHLMLYDFPGQGEALVGILDAFWESKGLTTPEAFRRFCCETVPLLRFESYVWTSSETFSAEAEVAHYGPKPIQDAIPVWSIRDKDGLEVASGKLQAVDIPTGSVTQLGEIRAPLASIKTAKHLTVTLRLENTPYVNDWNIWVYPEKRAAAEPGDVTVSERYDDAAREALADGKKVLLSFAEPQSQSKVNRNRFTPVFWSYAFFTSGPGTLGILCDPDHPSLEGFPTEFHSDWQWRELAQDSNAFVLDEAPADYRPLIQVVDDFHRNHKMGSVFETRVGPGRMLVCGYDLANDLPARPVARQLRQSLLAYMRSEGFDPKMELASDLLDEMLQAPPLAPSAGMPGKFEGAILNVRAAANLAVEGQDTPWEKRLDDIVSAEGGCDYRLVKGATWKDNDGAAWHGKTMTVTVSCPKGIFGTMVVHFHDWNSLGRRGLLTFEGKQYTLGEHADAGSWISFQVMREDTLDGELTLDVQATSGPNIMITQIALLPGE